MNDKVVIMPHKTLTDAQGRKIMPTVTAAFQPPDSWAQNPSDPLEYVRVHEALAISVRQHAPTVILIVMNIAENKAAAHSFEDAPSAFAFADLIFSALSFGMKTEPAEDAPADADPA